MSTSSLALLLFAAGAVGFLHAILPDHWVPLAVVGRTQRWSLTRVARTSALAASGHVLTSLILAAVVAVVGLQFQHQIDVQQGRIVGGVLILTGIGFLIWGMTGHGHHDHDHKPRKGALQPAEQTSDGSSTPAPPQASDATAHVEPGADVAVKTGTAANAGSSMPGRLAAIAVPFGVAASPDLTILPVALAASALGAGAIAGTLVAFGIITMATFVGLTVFATLAGYQIKGEWLEDHATTITAVVLVAIGIVAFVGF